MLNKIKYCTQHLGGHNIRSIFCENISSFTKEDKKQIKVFLKLHYTCILHTLDIHTHTRHLLSSSWLAERENSAIF